MKWSPTLSNKCLLVLVSLAGLWGQALERPAELKTVQSDFARRTAEWDAHISQQKAKRDRALDAAKASPAAYDRQIIAIGEGVKVLRLMIDRETDKIQFLDRFRGMATAQASIFESRELDVELAKQTADIRKSLDKAMADLKTKYEETQTSNTLEAQERLARSVNRVEDLKGTLERFEMAETKETEASSARAALAQQLRSQASGALVKIEQSQIKVKLVQATMAGVMISLRAAVDQWTTQQYVQTAPALLGASNNDTVFDEMVGAQVTYSKGTVLERANHLLSGNNP